jgi:REP element-mobilizing transposase RayT
VVLRVRADVPRLRRGAIYLVLHRAIRRANGREGFRVVHASIQHNHIHLLVEAGTQVTLSRGVQALAIATARGINRAHDRRGSVFAFRFHATAITSPRQMRSTLAYVLRASTGIPKVTLGEQRAVASCSRPQTQLLINASRHAAWARTTSVGPPSAARGGRRGGCGWCALLEIERNAHAREAAGGRDARQIVRDDLEQHLGDDRARMA